MMKDKLYPHIEGLRGDEGENAATLAVVAVLDPSPHYPDCGRIIVGSPEASESNVAGFCGGPEAIVQLAEVLTCAAADVDAVLDAESPPVIEGLGYAGRRCEVCCETLFHTDQVQVFGDVEDASNVVVHATRCTEPLPSDHPKQRIPALWFTSDGCGPDNFGLQLQPFPSELDGRIPASLGIRVRALDELVLAGRALVDGGFNLDRESVEELHRQLGEWLRG